MNVRIYTIQHLEQQIIQSAPSDTADVLGAMWQEMD
jgi:hypothetical protein